MRWFAVLVWVVWLCAAVGATDVPGTSGRVQFGGYVDGLAVVPTKSSPRQRPQGVADAWFDLEATDWLSGYVELRGSVGGPFEGAHADLYNYVHAFQNLSPSLSFDEAYADFRLRHADLRLGIQKFAWGKLDGIPPTDVLNPRSFHDPFVEAIEEAKIGIPAVAASYYPPDLPSLALTQLRATLIYIPLAVPSRLPLTEERWFPPTIRINDVVVDVPPIGQTLTVPVQVRTQNDAPPKTLAAGGIAIQLSGTWRSSDWNLYYYAGPVAGPNASLEAEALPPLEETEVIATLRQEHDSMQMAGGGWSAVFGGATVRAEGAFFDGQAYLRSGKELLEETLDDLTPAELERIVEQLAMGEPAPITLPELFIKPKSIQWGVGADYLLGGLFALLQVNQTILLESAPALLISDPSTRLMALLRRRFLRDRLELEVRAVYSIEREAWFAFPRVSYLFLDDLRARIGYLWLGGPERSVYGQFRDNDEFVFELRYSF